MKTLVPILFSFISFSSVQTFSSEQKSCGSFFQEEQAPFSGMPVDLRAHYHLTTDSLSVSEIAKLNKQTQKSFESFVPQRTGKKPVQISFSKFVEMYEFLEQEMVGAKVEHYNRPNCAIGFCFGRAFAAHMMLLKSGLDPSAIRKVWAVGLMNSGEDDILWDFHVATAAYVTGYGWMTLDTNFPKPLIISHWFANNISESIDQRVRVYVTDPRKFGINVGPYTKKQLGFDLSRTDDWYQHYFVDHTKKIKQSWVKKIED